MGVIKELSYKNWTLLSEVDETKNTYASRKEGGSDSCKCGTCKNFAMLREKIYPDEIKKLLTELGIDYKKDVEVCHFAKLENGLHLYSGWFHFRGSFRGDCSSTPLPHSGYQLNLTPVTDNFKIGFHNSDSLAFFENKENLVQVEFESLVPWILDEPEPQ